MKKNNFSFPLKKPLAVFLVFYIVFAYFFPILRPGSVEAGTMQQTYIRLDRVKASTATTGLVCAKTPSSGSGTEDDVQVVFPTGFTVSTTTGNWTVATSNIPSGASAWPGIGTATAASGQTVTFPSSALSTNTLYCFRWTSTAALTNPSAGNDKNGSITTRVATVAEDTGNYALSVISEDQISVSATVPLIFSMTLSGTTMPLGTLSTSTTTSSTARTTTFATNAAAGWIAWISGTQGNTSLGALHSTTANVDISAPGSSSDNTPTDLASNTGYVIDADITTDGSGTGTVTQASNFGAEFNGTNSTSGGSVTTVLQPYAASSGTTDGDVITLTARAKISATQAAASDYADTLTVVAAGRF